MIKKHFIICTILLLFIYACKETNHNFQTENNNTITNLLDNLHKDSLRNNPMQALQELEALCNQVTDDSIYYYAIRMNIAECHYINGKLNESKLESLKIINFCKQQTCKGVIRQLMFHAQNNCGFAYRKWGTETMQ